MTDVFTTAKRSEVMSRIHSRGNKDTEVALIRFLRQSGVVGWRRNVPMFGKPDFIFRDARLTIFVDGCFWHSCPYHCKMPQNNRGFWAQKLEANKRRDKLVNRTLRSMGWRTLRIWEHELSQKNECRLFHRIQRALREAHLVILKQSGPRKRRNAHQNGWPS